MLAIVAVKDVVKITAALAEKYPDNHLLLAAGQWLVASEATAQDVSKNLGITDGTNGSAIVLSFQTYFGRTNPQVWEWIATKMETTRG